LSSHYFTGTSVQGPVRASPARDFRDVVDTFRVCPTLAITRAAFFALPKAERNERKQVPFFTAACFRQSPSKRITEEATHCNLIFLDLDESKDGTCPAAPFVRNPQLLYTALGELNFIAHTTASSTPEKPRMRIVIDAHEIPLHLYAKAVATIGAMLGLTRITTESRVATQPMFLPVLFSDSTDDEHPLIAHRTDGTTFQPSDIGSAEAEWEHHTGSNGTNGSTDDIFFLRAPLPEISLAIAREALFKIDPDCDYYAWLECASALRHQFSPHHADEAYELFDEWSAEGTKYGGPEDTAAKWKSLRPTPHGRMPVTIRSLLHRAVQAGWDDHRVKESSFSKVLEWMEGCATSSELLEQGVKRILAAPQLSSMQEDMLVDKIRTCVKRRFGDSIDKAAIRKDLLRLREKIKEQSRPKEKLKEPMWARGLCYVTATEQFFRQRTGEKYTANALNCAYARHLLPTEEQLKELNREITPAAFATPIVPPRDYALNTLLLPTVTDYSYDPGNPTEMFFIERGIKWVNTYSPTYPELDHANSSNAGALFQQHLQNLIAEDDYRRVLIDFMAFIVQFPGRKMRWAVLIQGAEGCGKTLLAEAMKAVLGKEHVKTIDGQTVMSGWNDWAFGYQLVVLEEVRVQGANRYDIMNHLKPWITNDDIPINEKFRSSRDVRNISNYMMFSNHHAALALTNNDRRYFVVKSPLQTKAQVKALGHDYFPTIFRMIRERPGALRAWLAEWEISPTFDPDGHAPSTIYAQQMAEDSATDLLSAVRRLMLEGDYPLLQYDIVSAKMLVDVLELEGLRVTGQQVAHVLREEGFTQLGRHAFGDERHYLWSRAGVSNAVAVATERLKKNQKNLCMELLFS
jgi:hypothetical protein